MNLDVVWKKLVIDANNEAIELTASPQYINMATNVGLFIWFIYKEDTTLLSDGTTFSFAKLLTDTPFASDAQARAFGKFVSDTFTAIDSRALTFGKQAFDAASVADQLTKTVGATLVDSVTSVHDIPIRAFGKNITSLVTATDDLDGEATTEDDQEIQFFKVLSNATSVTDANTLTVGLAKADSFALLDTGSLRSQGYCDFTYFAEDYVGESRTFSISLARADTTMSSDAGLLRSQSFCDFTYFAEDYVGQSRTF